MLKQKRIIAVLGAVLVLAALGGFWGLNESSSGTSTSGDRAEITGYATSNVFGDTSGAVSVVLHGASAARIAQLAEALPVAALDDECTLEQKVYEITFTAGPGTKQGLDVLGFGCAHLVVDIPSHGPTAQRVDRNCALLSAVRRLIPASAIATHAEVCAR
jgi:hypothetical protein